MQNADIKLILIIMLKDKTKKNTSRRSANCNRLKFEGK